MEQSITWLLSNKARRHRQSLCGFAQIMMMTDDAMSLVQCSVSLPLKIIARDSVASPTTRPTRNSHVLVAWVQKTVEVEAVVERYELHGLEV